MVWNGSEAFDWCVLIKFDTTSSIAFSYFWIWNFVTVWSFISCSIPSFDVHSPQLHINICKFSCLIKVTYIPWCYSHGTMVHKCLMTVKCHLFTNMTISTGWGWLWVVLTVVPWCLLLEKYVQISLIVLGMLYQWFSIVFGRIFLRFTP